MSRRFFWGITVVAGVTLLIGGIAAAMFVGRSVEADRRDEFLRQAEATGLLLETSLRAELRNAQSRTDLTARAVLEVRTVLNVARRVGGHDYVEAVLVTGQRVIPLQDETPLLDALPSSALDVGGSRSYDDVSVGGDAVLGLTRRIEFSIPGRDLPVALVVAIGSTADLVPWDDVAGRMLFAALIAIGLAAVIAASMARWMKRRLDGLGDAAAAIAAGDLTARAPDDGDDELAAVAAAFNAMAVELEEARGRERDFLMSVSHDLRTPLTTIRGYAEGLAEGAIPPDDLPRIAGVLRSQADRLTRLVEDLMLLSRLQARQFTLRSQPVDLGVRTKEIVAGFEERAAAARVRLLVDVTPAGALDIDPDRYAQIVSNLVENALRYTPEGGIVTVKLDSDAGAVQLVVSDTGPGIDPDDLPRVFDRLFVAQRYRPVRPEGSGLGLAIVRELVDAMGATITVDSALGSGTTFRVSFRR